MLRDELLALAVCNAYVLKHELKQHFALVANTYTDFTSLRRELDEYTTCFMSVHKLCHFENESDKNPIFTCFTRFEGLKSDLDEHLTLFLRIYHC